VGAAGAPGARQRSLRSGAARPRAIGHAEGPPDLVGDGRGLRILLRGGVVVSFNPRVGDFEKADVPLTVFSNPYRQRDEPRT